MLLHHLESSILEDGVHMKSFGRAEREYLALDLGYLLTYYGRGFSLVIIE